MRKRDKKRENREMIHALTMILQIGLAMITCMGISFGIGYYLDRLLGTKFWIMIFLLIGIMASIRSLFILTKQVRSSDKQVRSSDKQVRSSGKEVRSSGGEVRSPEPQGKDGMED